MRHRLNQRHTEPEPYTPSKSKSNKAADQLVNQRKVRFIPLEPRARGGLEALDNIRGKRSIGSTSNWQHDRN